MKKSFSLFVFMFIAAMGAVAQQSIPLPSHSWTKNPFDQKVFIENKGQFNRESERNFVPEGMRQKILFSSSREGVQLYFTVKGLIYKHDELASGTEEKIKNELEDIGSPQSVKEEKYEKKKTIYPLPHYLSMEWVGSNPNAEIIAEEPVSFYYTYGDAGFPGEASVKAGKNANTTIKANAYKKIIYKDIYPNIDVEYVFPSDSSGIKYSFILHPGADPAAIKMKYENQNEAETPTVGNASIISLDPSGNILIKSSFGEFIDHAPKTFYKDSGKPISSSFSIKNNIVSFALPSPLSFREELGVRQVIIDPWTTLPTFTGFNSAFDVNYDLNANVYIYGSWSPLQLIKLDNTGLIQWIFTSGFSGSTYGDFAVDEVTGTSYLAPGSGSQILKVNTSGNQTGFFPGVGGLVTETWRMEYNRCMNTIVIGSGGNNSVNSAAILDTNLVTFNSVNVYAAGFMFHDITRLAIDNNSNFCYMTVAYNGFSATSNNILVKCPLPGLLPTSFSVPTGDSFFESQCVSYVNNSASSYVNGMNGMAVSPSWLYTYDSDSLKRWDKNTGALSAAIDAYSSVPSYTSVFTLSGPFDAIQIFWGGLAVDECDNIYVGVQNSIKVYDASLTLINTYTLTNTVYDLKLGPNNKLYACGKDFVTEIDVPSNNTAVTVSQTPASCNVCDGTATATISCGDPSGYNYSWNTSPVQNTQTAIGLCPGNYTVTISTNCFVNFTGSVTITGGSGALSATVTSTPAVCGNNNGSATANITGGVAPYTYTWSPSGGTNATATGLAAGSYTVTIADTSGCGATNIVTVASSGSITAAAGPNTTICSGQTTTITASGGTNYSWSNGQSTGTITVTPTSTTTYSVIATSGTCADTASAMITVAPSPAAAITANTTICTGDTTTLTASGGTGYSWNTGANSSSITVSPTTSSVYTVTVTENGCSQIATVTITTTAPLVNISAIPVTVTMGNSSQLSASGGGAYLWSPSAGLSCTTCSNPIAVPSQTTTYCVIVTDAANCTNSACITISVEINCSNTGELYLPNAFSPNADNENDVLKIYYGNYDCIKIFNLVIYDRWGEEIFATTDAAIEWDGMYAGRMMHTQVFAYYLEATLISGEQITKKGNISLIK